jgi:hypothetical protein
MASRLLAARGTATLFAPKTPPRATPASITAAIARLAVERRAA